MSMDPITLEVLNNRLRETVSTMEHLLFHSGYSTVLRESYDGSAGICERDGSTVMASGSPYHMVAYAACVQGVLRNYALEDMREGDSYVLNDPYLGGSFHVPDLAVVTPAYAGGAMLGFCVSIAHKTDVGGLVPGSSGAGSREIFHDGTLLPGVRYWTRDGVVPDIEAIVKRNSRAPETVAGDIRAQIGCTRTGTKLLSALCDEYSPERVLEAFRALQAISERRVRAGLADWPDGEAQAEALVDHDGVDLDQPLRMHARVIKNGDALTIDFSGMNAQVKGPINLRPQHAYTGAVLALLAHVDPTIAVNQGALRPITLINPEGRITNARWPAPVNSYYGMMHLVQSILQKAFVRFEPKRAVGTFSFGLSALASGFKRGRTGKQAILYELICTSMGGTPVHDGTFPVQPMSQATPNTPVEILESEFPVRVLAHTWQADRAGAGRYRGGPGFLKIYQILEDATVTLRAGHHFKYPGWGVLGGHNPPTPKVYVRSEGKPDQFLGPLHTLNLRAGDAICFELPGGGGYGDPATRPPEEVLEDVLNGYVSIERATRDYAVAIDAERQCIDAAGTARLRRAPK